MNSGVGFTTNSGATNSGYGNTGQNISGFFNSASGGVVNLSMSGFFNSASGGTITDGFVSGFFNRAVPGALFGSIFATDVSGVLNSGSFLSGLFGLNRLLQPG